MNSKTSLLLLFSMQAAMAQTAPRARLTGKVSTAPRQMVEMGHKSLFTVGRSGTSHLGNWTAARSGKPLLRNADGGREVVGRQEEVHFNILRNDLKSHLTSHHQPYGSGSSGQVQIQRGMQTGGRGWQTGGNAPERKFLPGSRVQVPGSRHQVPTRLSHPVHHLWCEVPWISLNVNDMGSWQTWGNAPERKFLPGSRFLCDCS